MDKTNSDTHLIQFLLLWWTKHSPFNGTALASILLQHHVGCYEEGGRAIELLHRSSEDLKALSSCTDIMHDRYDGDDCSQHITGAYWVADRSEELGSCYAARVSFVNLHCIKRKLTIIWLSSIVVGSHILFPVSRSYSCFKCFLIIDDCLVRRLSLTLG